MKKLLAIIVLLFLVPLAYAASYKPINYVSDYAEVISPEQEAQINALAAAIEKNSTVQIAILTVPTLNGQDINQFAVETFAEWGVGRKDVYNGLLLVVAVADRKWKIEVGYGLEGLLNDA